MVKNVNKDSFNEIIKEGRVIVDFYAKWCGPCKMLSPMLEEISNNRSDVTIAKVDVDAEPELASMFKVMSVPTLVLFSNGKQVSTKQGFMSVDMLEEWLKEIE